MGSGVRHQRPGRDRRSLLLAAGATGLCLALALYGTGAAGAEDKDVLSVGEWTGTYRLSGTDPIDATFEVEKDADSGEWSIVMVLDVDHDITYRFENLVVTKDRLEFKYVAGENVRKCDLGRTGAGEFHGDCVGVEKDDSPRKVHLIMRPPHDNAP